MNSVNVPTLEAHVDSAARVRGYSAAVISGSASQLTRQRKRTIAVDSEEEDVASGNDGKEFESSRAHRKKGKGVLRSGKNTSANKK
jgi:hypothetical protein